MKTMPVKNPGFSRMTIAQAKALRRYVTGVTVVDLGGGEGHQALSLIRLGAKSVTLIDEYRYKFLKHLKLRVVKKTFNDAFKAQKHYGLAFISWPLNKTMPGLLDFIDQAPVVAYLGKNTDGTACGWHEFWVHLAKRELITEVRDRANTLLIYGQDWHKDIQLRCEEEVAGLLSTCQTPFNIIRHGSLINYEEPCLEEKLLSAQTLPSTAAS